ncbi:MAG: hypothetical protein Q4D96_03935 [Propionibacteriaceae bacterium]|nr:hypothetical protein [Propionibacteriaceae bacterium]
MRLPGVSAASFSPVSDAVAVLFDDGVLQVRHGDLVSLEVATGLFGMQGPRHAWSPDGRHILAADAASLQVRDAASGALVSSWEAPMGWLGTSWSPDGRHIASGGEGGCAIWEPLSGQRLHRLLPAEPDVAVTWTAWSSDAARLAAGILLADDSAEVRIWDARTGQRLRVIAGLCWGSTACWRADGRHILAHCEESGRVQEIDAASGQVRRGVEVRDDHDNTVLDWHPTQPIAATGGADGAVTLWDLDSGRRLHRLQAHAEGIHHVEFRTDGSRLLSIADDDTVHIQTF